MELKADKSKQLDDVLKILEEGKDPIEYLEGLGYKVPTQAWADLKIWARKHRPDDRKKMPDNMRLYYATHDLVNKTGNVHEHNQNRVPPPPPAPPGYEPPKEVVQVKGKDGRVENVKLYGDKPSPTCCQPARESGVTVPDEIPEEVPETVEFNDKGYIRQEPEPMEIVGVRSRVKGYYMKAEVNPALVDGNRYVRLIWRDLVTREERSIGLSVQDWKKLAEEIPQAMKQLGF